MTHIKDKLRAAECGVPGCQNPVRHIGLCLKHYSRNRRNGSPHITKRAPRKSVLQWIESLLRKETDDCILWPFAKGTAGYGVTRHEGKQTSAHRVVLRLIDPAGEFEGALGLHTCARGDQGCVNPRHLYWGTAKQNMDDRRADGNSPQGSACYASKLSEADIIPIFQLSVEGLKPSEIAASFGVSKGAINFVLRRKTWRNVSVPSALLDALAAKEG